MVTTNLPLVQRRGAIEIKRGLSPDLRPGFFSALEDVKPDKSFVIYGGDDRYRLKPTVEAIGLRLLLTELLALHR